MKSTQLQTWCCSRPAKREKQVWQPSRGTTLHTVQTMPMLILRFGYTIVITLLPPPNAKSSSTKWSRPSLNGMTSLVMASLPTKRCSTMVSSSLSPVPLLTVRMRSSWRSKKVSHSWQIVKTYSRSLMLVLNILVTSTINSKIISILRKHSRQRHLLLSRRWTGTRPRSILHA